VTAITSLFSQGRRSVTPHSKDTSGPSQGRRLCPTQGGRLFLPRPASDCDVGVASVSRAEATWSGVLFTSNGKTLTPTLRESHSDDSECSKGGHTEPCQQMGDLVILRCSHLGRSAVQWIWPDCVTTIRISFNVFGFQSTCINSALWGEGGRPFHPSAIQKSGVLDHTGYLPRSSLFATVRN